MNKDSTLLDEKPIVTDDTDKSDDFETIDDDSISPSFRKMMSQVSMAFHSEQRIMSSADKVAEKLTPEHITQIIANSEQDDSRQFSAFKWNSIIKLIIFFASLLFAIFLLVFFRNSEYFITLLAALFSFLGGLGVGKHISIRKNTD